MLRKLLYPHSLIVTGLVFVVLGLLNIIRINANFLNPFREATRSYEITDLVYSRLWDKRVRLDNRIVLVNTGRPDREQLYRVIDRISASHPKVIAVDVLLSERKNAYTDSLLRQSIQRAKSVVLAVELDSLAEAGNIYERPASCDTFFCNYAYSGFINFIAFDSTSTIRLFSARENTKTGLCLAFAAQTARLYDPKTTDVLLNKQREVLEIYYSGNQDQFVQFEMSDVLDTTLDLSQRFKDKIVFIGYLGDAGWGRPLLDLHYTPLNARYIGYPTPDMYGMVIHANITQMILDRKYIQKVPFGIHLLLTFLFCYANIHLYYRLFRRVSLSYRYLIRFLQLSEIIVLFFLVAFLFHFFRLKLNVLPWIAALMLTFDAVKIYDKIVRKNVAFLKRIPYELDAPKKSKKEKTQATTEATEATPAVEGSAPEPETTPQPVVPPTEPPSAG